MARQTPPAGAQKDIIIIGAGISGMLDGHKTAGTRLP